MKIEKYEDLRVWQKGIDLTMKIYSITKNYPGEEKFGLTSQMRRASVSISSNIAEGWSRNNDPSFNLFLSYSKGSLTELATQAVISNKLNYINNNVFTGLKTDIDKLSRMIFFLQRTLKPDKEK